MEYNGWLVFVMKQAVITYARSFSQFIEKVNKMSIEMRALTVISVHIIGAIITLIVFYKTGEFEEAVKHGDGIYWATPSDVVFQALVMWELLLLLYIMCSIDSFINMFFYKLYRKELNCNENDKYK